MRYASWARVKVVLLQLTVASWAIHGCEPSVGEPPAGCAEGSCEVLLEHVTSLSDSADPGLFTLSRALWVQRDASGRFFVGTASADRIAVFESTGTLLTQIGRRGSGPGEFQRAGLAYIGPGDSIYVADSRLGRITVISPDLSISRTVRLPYMPAFVQPDGSFIVAGQIHTPESIGYPVHRVSTRGRLVTSFGIDTPQYRGDLRALVSRVVAPGHDGSVLAVAPGNYVIERWDASSGGKIGQVAVRSDWFSASTGTERRIHERPAPLIVGLWEGNDGLIWTLIRDADSGWERPPVESALAERPRDPDEYDATYDWIVEAVDASTGGVVASRRFDRYLGYRPPTPLLVSARIVDNREVVLDVWRAVLQRKEQQP